MTGRIVVLISGNGGNLQAVIDACADGRIDGQIVAVISNKKSAYGLERAQNHEIPAVHFPYKPYRESGREAYDSALADEVTSHQPDLIVLAGWLRILTPSFLDRFPRQVINLHPALPGQFDGLHAVERAYEAYQAGKIDVSGCMIHYAIPKVDAGEVIEWTIVEIKPDDTLQSFGARITYHEHRIIVKAVQKVLRQQKEAT